MSSPRYDLIIAGGGIVGSACALACTRAGLRVALVERDVFGSGATAAGMGHIVVMDDSEAQFALTRFSQELWMQLGKELPAAAEYCQRGTIWVAADEEEMVEAERKHRFLRERKVPCQLLSPSALAASEPKLRPGLAGGLLVSDDAIVFAPAVSAWLAQQAAAAGTTLITGHAVTALRNGEALLGDGRVLHAEHLLNATGAEARTLHAGLPVRKRKGQLAITDRYPGFAHHQIVELGYLKSAHSNSRQSVAFNIQPRPNGQILIGSSRQFDDEGGALDRQHLARMLGRVFSYMPALAELNVLRTWTGFRAATPDKLPLIGPAGGADASLWLATGHEGLGCTTALATAELIAAQLCGSPSPIAPQPYLPARFLSQDFHSSEEIA